MRSYAFLIRTISLGMFIFLGVSGLRAERIYGISAASSSGAAAAQNLVRFDSATPGVVITVGNINVGKIAGHAIRSIDFRPATNQLYAISTDTTFPSQARVYTVNLATGAVTPIGATDFVLGNNSSQAVEMEFDPTTDTIRVLTGASKRSGQNNNFRVSPVTGALIATDPNIDYSTSTNPTEVDNGISAGAYTNNFAGASQTTLYVWDWTAFDVLATLGGVNGSQTPNNGQIAIVNLPQTPLTSPSGQGLGMDISPNSGILFVTHDSPADPNVMSLYTRPLTPVAQGNEETLIGPYPAGTFIVDISVRRDTTAAEVSVTGQVVTPTGRGLVRAIVTLTDSQGLTQTVSSGRGGVFTFNKVEAGKAYFITVQSQQYTYDPQFIQVDESVTGLRIRPSTNQ